MTAKRLFPRPSRRSPWSSSACTIGFIIALAISGAEAFGQTTPLEDALPLAELEVRADDLIRLSTASADAVRELKNARLTLETLATLRPNAVITNLEYQIACTNAETAQQKVRLLRAIAEKLLAAAEAKVEVLQRLESLGKAGAGPPAARERVRLAQAEATVMILKMIIETE